MSSVARVVADARRLVLVCRASGIPAPTEALEASLRMLDAELGVNPSTECAPTRPGGSVIYGQLEAGREYFLLRDGEAVMNFKFMCNAGIRRDAPPEGFIAVDVVTGETKTLYYADVGMTPYASGKWSESCRVVKADMDAEDARRLLKELGEDGEDMFPRGPLE